MIELIRPMLAAPAKTAELRALKWPMLASWKLDGIRALCRRNPETGKPELVSRKLIRIPNEHCQHLFARAEYVGLDGELMVGEWNDPNVYNKTNSGVMSVAGTPDVRWVIFDRWDSTASYGFRAWGTREICNGYPRDSRVCWLSQHVMHSFEELEAFEEATLEQGYEGVILRSPTAPYKQNRSTLKQAYMLKMKRFEDSEAEVIGYAEQMRNENEATTDELGYTKRSSHQAGKVGAGILGALSVRDVRTGVEFDVGTGFTLEQRTNLWEGRKYLPGKLIKYRHFPVGVKDKPRFPTFVGFRDRRDT